MEVMEEALLNSIYMVFTGSWLDHCPDSCPELELYTPTNSICPLSVSFILRLWALCACVSNLFLSRIQNGRQ